MIIKGLIDEDFVNYKKPSMFIAFPNCTFKCEKECGQSVCQNGALATSPDLAVSSNEIVNRYMGNNITHAIVFGGLEPFHDVCILENLIREFRMKTLDDIVIYTGFYKDEIAKDISALSKYSNIIVKFGRYVPDQNPHFDSVLGVNLASDNQHAERIS